MRCVACGNPLLAFELPQPLLMMGLRLWSRALCTGCCRANLWPGGSGESIERLRRGGIDEAERAKVAEATKSWGVETPARA